MKKIYCQNQEIARKLALRCVGVDEEEEITEEVEEITIIIIIMAEIIIITEETSDLRMNILNTKEIDAVRHLRGKTLIVLGKLVFKTYLYRFSLKTFFT